MQGALRSLSAKQLKAELESAEQALEARIPPPGEGGRARWLALNSGRQALVVPTAANAVSSFDPELWSGMDPRSFVYGDGVFGIERENNLTFDEWARWLCARDELAYDSIFDRRPQTLGDDTAKSANAAPVACEGGAGAAAEAEGADAPAVDEGTSGLPRWRDARDLQTVL